MILKSDEIARLLELEKVTKTGKGLAIVPSPELSILRKEKSASVDLMLGTWFLSLIPAHMGSLSLSELSAELKLTESHYVPLGGSYFLHPGNFVLGMTIEWIRMPSNLAGFVVGKSSWGRRGLIIATATGVHPYFAGTLTLELSNLGEIPIELTPGTSICQLCLHKTIGITDEYPERMSSFFGSRRPRLGKIDITNNPLLFPIDISK
jgi:dCTP deaminase